MRRPISSDSSSVPGSIWLNRRSSENTPVRIRLGGSLRGWGGTRSISITILARLVDSEGGGPRRPSFMPKPRNKKRAPKRVFALPDLEQAKSAVLNTLTSVSGQRTYDHAINDFVEWYCSEPRLAFNRTVVLRYRIYMEQKGYAPNTINLRLAAVRRVAYEACDSGLLSPELGAGIRRVKVVRRLGARLGNWLTPAPGKLLLERSDTPPLRGKRNPTVLAIRNGWALTPCELLFLATASILV